MKKFMIMAVIFVGLTLSLQARDWNIPKGSYTCEIVSINNAQWKPTKYIPQKIRKSNHIGIILDDTKIVDASGVTFDNQGDNSEGTNYFMAETLTDAIYIPTNSKLSDGKYSIGLGHVVNGSVVRMVLECSKD